VSTDRVAKPKPRERVRCPRCYAFGAVPHERIIPGRSGRPDRAVSEYVMPDCPTCGGRGYVDPARHVPNAAQ
jgi:hypothetical protein